MNWKTRLALIALCAACSKDKFDVTKPASVNSNNITLAYEKGLREMKDQNYLEATAIFEYLRNNYPYSQYAALSELALADMQYQRDEYLTAANAYADFVKAHPSHPKADYAAFRVGLCYYQEKPGDWWILPPSYERDQTPVRQALDAWNKFVVSYPKSEYVTKARDLINDCRQRLAAHDRYVAEFYAKREAWRGAAGRWLAIADNFGDLDEGKLRGESLWRAAVAWRNANDLPDERNALLRLVQESPRDPHRAQAETMLRHLPADAPRPLEKAPATELPSPPERPQAGPAPGEAPGAQPIPAPDPKPQEPSQPPK